LVIGGPFPGLLPGFDTGGSTPPKGTQLVPANAIETANAATLRGAGGRQPSKNAILQIIPLAFPEFDFGTFTAVYSDRKRTGVGGADPSSHLSESAIARTSRAPPKPLPKHQVARNQERNDTKRALEKSANADNLDRGDG
jgi:hypothetical protein